jgi:hypothetical protein
MGRGARERRGYAGGSAVVFKGVWAHPSVACTPREAAAYGRASHGWSALGPGWALTDLRVGRSEIGQALRLGRNRKDKF